VTLLMFTCLRTRTTASPPWDDWDLSPKFFAALSRWTHDHPETSLDRLLKDICVGIENSGEFMSFIPDSPFPARGLIQALASLVKLGAVRGSCS
jgi:hypothetical protein